MTSQHTIKTNAASLFPTFNFCLQVACVALRLNFSKICLCWLPTAWRRIKGSGLLTLQIHLWFLANNSHIILLGSSFRLLIRRIKNIQGSLHHVHSRKIGGYQPQLQSFLTAPLMGPRKKPKKHLKPNHRHLTLWKTAIPSRTAPSAEIDWDRNITCLCWSALICASCTTGSRDKMTMCPWSASPDLAAFILIWD